MFLLYISFQCACCYFEVSLVMLDICLALSFHCDTHTHTARKRRREEEEEDDDDDDDDDEEDFYFSPLHLFLLQVVEL